MVFYNNNFYYKTMDWYNLLGFNQNEMRDGELTREEYCSKYLEVAYQKRLAMLNRNDLGEINLFKYNYKGGGIENAEELREKIAEAYNTLKDPQKRKEYEFEIFGIFCREYPEDEIADEKFKDRAILLLEEDEKWDGALKNIWKVYLSVDYWKNWREKVTTAKYKEEIKFYIIKFNELRMFILNTTGWGKEVVNENDIKKIKQKEIDLQNMSKEEWWNRDGEWRGMHAKEVSDMLGQSPNYDLSFEKSQQDLSSKTSPENQILVIKRPKTFHHR